MPGRCEESNTIKVQRKNAANLLLVVSLIIGVVLTEVGIRMRQWIKYGTTEIFAGGHFEIDPHSGLRIPVPGATTGSITINSLGFRSPEIEIPKPSSTVRLAFLGASTTFSSEVSGNEKTWPHLVWQQLQVLYPNVSIDYVNAAVPGYTTSSSLRKLEHRVRPLQPDVIVIYHATNDLASNSRKLAYAQGKYREPKTSWMAEKSLL